MLSGVGPEDQLNEHDIARHHLVKHIINAYSKSKG